MITRLPSWRAAGVLVVALGVAGACGGSSDDDDDSAGSGGAGGTSGKGSGGTGGWGGGGNEGGGGSGGTTSNPGTIDSIWKQVEAEVMTFNTTGGVPMQATVELPALFPVPDTDAEIEIYQAIRGSVLHTYAHVDGAPSYYLVKTALTSSGSVYLHTLGIMSGIYELEDGVLTFSATLAYGSSFATSKTRFEAYSGDFPPPDWPAEVVELDLTTGGAP
jgi:hypothetical protein